MPQEIDEERARRRLDFQRMFPGLHRAALRHYEEHGDEYQQYIEKAAENDE